MMAKKQKQPPELFYKISQENTCARVLFLIKLQASGLKFIKKETLAQVFFCEFCEIFKNTFFYRKSLVAASIINISK